MDIQQSLTHAMTALDEEQVLSDIRTMMERGYPCSTIQMCLNQGITGVGKLFELDEYFIADLIVSGMIYRDALNLLCPTGQDVDVPPLGRIVIGVAEGDIHDIGKDIVVSLLRSERFEVIDLGIDVKPERFGDAVRTYRPNVLLLCGVLTTTRDSMAETMQRLRGEGLLDRTKVLVGGLCASEFLMTQIGADAWAHDTAVTVSFCKDVAGVNRGIAK